jgi:uncharacterized protein RhaS with RHS repeats
MAGRFTQPDPIGLAGGLNLYGFAGGDPANFADPFGLDTVYVGCRPVRGDNRSEEGQRKWGHCAVRISDKERGIDGMVEMTPGDHPGWPTPEIRSFGPDTEEFARYGGMWFPVAVPEGMSVTEFDDAVALSIYTQSTLFNGKLYYWGGEGNSNAFVYRVVSGAGGQIPARAFAHIPRVPGICGGTGLQNGTDCSP